MESFDWVVPPSLAASVAAGVGYSATLPTGLLHRGLPSPHLTVILTFGTPLRMLSHPSPDQPAGNFDVLVGGLHDTPALIDMGGFCQGIQLSLTPLGSRSLLGAPAGELAKLDVQGTDIFGESGSAELTDRLAAVATWPERFAALERFLLQRLRPARLSAEVLEAFRVLQVEHGRTTVGAVARHVGYSPRRLGQLFATEIGLAPKAVARVSRFDAARRVLVRRTRLGVPLDLAGLAVNAGYFDQAHLAREFVSIAGLSPTAWHAAEFGAGEFRSVQAEGHLSAAR